MLKNDVECSNIGFSVWGGGHAIFFIYYYVFTFFNFFLFCAPWNFAPGGIAHPTPLPRGDWRGKTTWNKQLKEAAVKAWKSITKVECNILLMSVGCRLFNCKQDICQQILSVINFHSLIKILCSTYFWSPKNWTQWSDTNGAMFEVV